MHRNYSTKDIREAIKNIVDPITEKSLVESNAIKHIGVDPDKDVVVLIVVLTKIGGEEEKLVKRQLAKIIKLDLGFTGIKIQFE